MKTIPLTGRSAPTCPGEPALVVTHISAPIRPGTLWVRMVNKAEWLERIRRRQTTPTGSWVKEVLRLRRENGLAGQPDSPSRRAGWGLILNAVGASCPISFTIQASWMGSLPDLCVTTSRLPPANGYEPSGFGLIGPRTLRSDEPFFCTAKPRNLPVIHGFNGQPSTFNRQPIIFNSLGCAGDCSWQRTIQPAALKYPLLQDALVNVSSSGV